MAGNTPVGGDAHLDAPLSNVAIRAFQSVDGYIAPLVMPVVSVAKQSNKYYVIDKDNWLRIENSYRAPKAKPNRIEFQVSSDGYHADNYALATENAKEDLANADNAIRLRENSVQFVSEMLARDYEVRVANICTSGTQLGSYVSLSGTAKWSDYTNSDPISDVTTAQATIRAVTGFTGNTAIIDHDTHMIVRRHPKILDMFKYTKGGMATMDELKEVFEVDNILIAKGIKNNQLAGATASITNIWGNNVLIARIQPGLSLQTATFGLTMRWQPSGIPAPMQVSRYDDPDPGKKVEVIEASVYQDEKVVAKDLSYGILSAI